MENIEFLLVLLSLVREIAVSHKANILNDRILTRFYSMRIYMELNVNVRFVMESSNLVVKSEEWKCHLRKSWFNKENTLSISFQLKMERLTRGAASAKLVWRKKVFCTLQFLF